MNDERSAPVCSHCGHVGVDRRYHCRETAEATCEQCWLDSLKELHGLVEHHPYEGFVEALAAALDLRERETGLHSKRVAAHTLFLARQFFSEPQELREIYWGSLLHDIGKIGVPDEILLKPYRLSEAQWQIMREHPRNGFQILSKLPALAKAGEIVLCHEERFDGTGYPNGLRGEAIPLPARLFAVVDTLDAMTFDRPYHQAVSFDAAKAEIVAMAGRQFDPAAVDAFLHAEEALREMNAIAFP